MILCHLFIFPSIFPCRIMLAKPVAQITWPNHSTFCPFTAACKGSWDPIISSFFSNRVVSPTAEEFFRDTWIQRLEFFVLLLLEWHSTLRTFTTIWRDYPSRFHPALGVWVTILRLICVSGSLFCDGSFKVPVWIHLFDILAFDIYTLYLYFLLINRISHCHYFAFFLHCSSSCRQSQHCLRLLDLPALVTFHLLSHSYCLQNKGKGVFYLQVILSLQRTDKEKR